MARARSGTPGAERPRTSSGGRTVRFAAGFLLIIAALCFLSSIPAALAWVHEPLSRAFAHLAAGILSVAGQSLAVETHLTFDGFTMEIVEACNGVLPAIIYVAAVLAFPSRWRTKATGIALGLPAIFVINLIRVLSLMICGAIWPEVFHLVHIYVWQVLVVALALGLWALWAETCALGDAVEGGRASS